MNLIEEIGDYSQRALNTINEPSETVIAKSDVVEALHTALW